MKKNTTALFLCILAISTVFALAIAAATIGGEGAMHDTGIEVKSASRDIAVTGVSVSPTTPIVDSACTITVTVKNEGRVWAANVDVSASVDGVKETTKTIDRLAPDAEATKAFTHTFTDAGFYTITGSAEPIRGETEVTDNSLSKMIMTEEAVTEARVANESITTEKVANESITTEKIVNKTIDDKDLGDDAIPKIGKANGTEVVGLNNTWTEIDNGSITTERKTMFIITYTANCTNTTIDNAVLINVAIDGESADPGAVSIADSWTVNLARTTTFLNTSVSAGTHSVNVSAKTRVADGTYTNLTDRVFTVIAIPTE